MEIEDLDREECLEFLARSEFVRLACAWEGQPYITPIRVARNGDVLYAFTTFGRKIEWMRANPLVCVEADEVESLEKWCSVIALGRYEEIPKDEGRDGEHHLAHALLWNKGEGWERGYARTILHARSREIVPSDSALRRGKGAGSHRHLHRGCSQRE